MSGDESSLAGVGPGQAAEGLPEAGQDAPELVVPWMKWASRGVHALRGALALGALALIPLGQVGLFEVGLFAVGYVATALGITAGHHRLFAHRSYEAKPWLRAALAVVGTMAWQGSPLVWAGMHRRHHRHTDLPGDPHSPHHPTGGLGGFWHAHLGWMVAGQPEPWVRQVPDLLADPMQRAVHRWRWLLVLLSFALPAALGGWYHHSAMGALAGLLWGGALRMVLVEHAVFLVNSWCHWAGTRPFNTKDQSTNSRWVAAVIMGEGWHNNHHAFPASARHGLLPGQWDPTHALIQLWVALGWASKVVRISPEQMAAKLAPEWAHRLPESQASAN